MSVNAIMVVEEKKVIFDAVDNNDKCLNAVISHDAQFLFVLYIDEKSARQNSIIKKKKKEKKETLNNIFRNIFKVI